jgi:hypothetical protein
MVHVSAVRAGELSFPKARDSWLKPYVRCIVSSAAATAGGLSFPKGWISWLRPYVGWFLLVCILTSLLCGATILYLDIDRPSDSTLRSRVNITVNSGIVSISPEILADGTLQVTSNSSVPVDLVVETEDGRDISTYSGLLPGESACLEYVEPCTVIASAS